MITVHYLTWDNWFSYGDKNNIKLSENKLTQISGINGSGKSSIPIILEELLYSKNHKPFKKSQLINRHLNNPTLIAEVFFTKDDDEYLVKLKRKSTISLSLIKNGEDISSHTSTGTYATLQNILGIDFNTFCQLIYQSSKNNLQFLTDTDTNRKKFLINLFGLNKYLNIHEKLKKITNEINNEIQQISGKLSTTLSWIDKNEKEDLNPIELKTIPVINKTAIDYLTDLKVQLSAIAQTNKRINDNNQYKAILSQLDTSIVNENIEVPDKTGLLEQKKKVETNKITQNSLLNIHLKNIKEIESLPDTCPKCKQPITEDIKNTLIENDIKEVKEININMHEIEQALLILENSLKTTYELEKRYREKEKVSDELTKLLNLIDNELPSEVQNKEELQKDIDNVAEDISIIENERNKNIEFNNSASAHNSRVEVVKQQLVEYKEQLEIIQDQLKEKEFIYNSLNIIKKAFGTNGLLNYKIEFLTKDLETEINSYLTELSKGRFQLIFALNGEKLNIDIMDDGKTISIEELSTGELARVNTATLLAIRKLMASISNTKLNILFLDEITGVLDDEGKEKLVEILLEEEDLNTFLVSHEYSHPLIPKITIVKENKISRIENG